MALLAAVLQDDVLARSLVEIYLSPLGEDDNDGAVLRRTLRAYFATAQNARATAARLKINRGTVHKHIGMIEERLGRLPTTCRAELEVALGLEELREWAR